MIAAARPRFNLCAACVRARGLERGDTFEQVCPTPDTFTSVGKCDDCGVNDAELETWRRIDAPPPTQPQISSDDRAVVKR